MAIITQVSEKVWHHFILRYRLLKLQKYVRNATVFSRNRKTPISRKIPELWIQN